MLKASKNRKRGSDSVDPTDTKHKIMLAAFELFGRFGFVGTSIRQIAQQSAVNLAAVNYHFKNKENLFWEIMQMTFKELDEKIEEIAMTSESTLDLAGKIYDYFLTESLAVKNTMKMMLAEGISPPPGEFAQSALKNPMGPPGGEHIANMIQKDIQFRLNREGMLWGVKSIFGTIFHWSLLISTGRICDSEGPLSDPLMSERQMRIDVLRMVESSMTYLAGQKNIFEAVGEVPQSN